MKKKVFITMILMFLGIIIVIAQTDSTGVDPTPAKDLSWIWQVLSLVLTTATALLGRWVVKIKGKARDVVNLGLQSAELLAAGTDLADYSLKASEDNVFTDAEKQLMKEKATKFKNEKTDVVAAWKLLWGKKSPV